MEQQVRMNRKFIEHMLVDHEMTARDLAASADLSEITVYRVMHGRSFHSDTLEKIAAALNCSPIDLIVAEGYPDPLVGASAASF